MLTIYRSNKAEWLAEILGHELRLNPPEITEEVNIIVSTWPSSRWLSEQISLINNINALVNYPFPGTYLKRLVKRVIGIDPNEKDPWEKNHLVWDILEFLPELIKREEAQVIRSWLAKSEKENEQINMNSWDLANNIAEIFDDYILYRPEIIKQWLSKNKKNVSRDIRVNKNILWQETLFKLLHEKINKDPFCIQAEKAINSLKKGKIYKKDYPKNLYIYGLSSLAPLQIDLIQAFSKVINIKIYLISPCNDLWQRCETRRLRFRNTWNTPPDRQWLLESPRLEAFLGRMGAEFQQLLEGSGEYQLGERNEEDIFSLTADITSNKGNKPNILEQLQQELLFTKSENVLTKEKSDKSLLFLKSPGKYRQVELIRDHILQLFANNKKLQPRDVLIMTPQIDSYKAIFASVFNNIDHNTTQLPWVITDRSQEDKVGLIHFVLNLLEISASRLTASVFENLLTNPALQKQQNISIEEVSDISKSLQSAGFTWGLDSSERFGEETHSLCWCLERFLLGLVLPDDPINGIRSISPYSENISNIEFIKAWGILSKLCNYIDDLRSKRSCKEWIKLITLLVKDLFGDGGEWAWEEQQLLTIVNNWGLITDKCELEIDCLVVKDIITKALSCTNAKFGHRTGKITISALEPMRAIPHQIIILMGLESGTFPRIDNRKSFNLLERKRELGDPNQYDKDRYSLLEALISTRQNLLLAWNSKDEKTGEDIEPPSPIQQWLNYLKIKLGANMFKDILIEPPANPLDQFNFIKTKDSQIMSCDNKNLEAREWLEKAIPTKKVALALPINWEEAKGIKLKSISFEQTKEWLLNPQTTWLRENDIQSKEFVNLIQDNDLLELSELERYQLLKYRLENSDISKVNDIKNNKNYWKETFSGKGVFPPKGSGIIEEELLEERWNNLLSAVYATGEITKRSIELQELETDFYFSGKNLIQIEIGSLKYKNLMNGWLNHLYLSANSSFNSKTLIISKKIDHRKNINFGVSKKILPINTQEATKILKEISVLAAAGRKNCWPIPPESGLAYAIAKNEQNKDEEDLFKKKWEGDVYIEGEREALKMELCFGKECNASTFLDVESFHEVLMSLYEPLLKNTN
ncbi:exodeoxyribonuclease V subunit gamma [Prochlorococcus marinus]|uniref:Exodeoxyribonuclease V subunit gamma n=1 Tax=Prochlorococcus marinus XMU1408 TaxID=2213228 RepID=A0A318QYP4_PROMR|nr:exodeoxyribonuclease V subunit gamma [Prochlorococcus marinus]MBW3042249.1 exodeoxyribonuclease V subunit gamma [Prochlorococcus marinus str. XMU1408]PYE01638.1 exodeoxyribonuclease V subunit gamma [Prochlorococcus marinus XMU1408]